LKWLNYLGGIAERGHRQNQPQKELRALLVEENERFSFRTSLRIVQEGRLGLAVERSS
jgi:hypothetical protein